MKKTLSFLCVISFCVFLLTAGCYMPGGPVPEAAHPPAARAWTEQDVDRVVVMEEQTVYSPAPWNNGDPPPQCDYIHFLRFRPADGTTLLPGDSTRVNPVTTDAMLVMLPGFIEGANGFEYIGRQLVYMAKTQRNKNIEVWAIDRRPNTLEDLSAFNYVEGEINAGRMSVDEGMHKVMDYYYRGIEVNGKTFQGWLKSDQVPFLSEFGLKLATEDVFSVVKYMVPNRSVRKKKVFVGGHSMGGFMASAFASWDLDGDPSTLDDAGFNNCAGLFGLDTTVTPMAKIIEQFLSALPDWMVEQMSQGTEDGYVTLVNSLRTDPTSPRIVPMPLLDAEAMALLESVAMMAYYAPDQENTIMREVPFSGNAKMVLSFMHSRDYATFMDSTPYITDFRYTNEALLGVVFDDSFAPVGMIQTSMGFLGGGTVVEKQFPMAEMLKELPIISDILSNFFGKMPLFIANDAGPDMWHLGQGPLYHWVNYDEVGDASDPDFRDTEGAITYTTTENEVSDIHDVARALFKGNLNLTEWYFSTRLLVDQMAAMFPYARKYGINMLHMDRLAELPKIEFIAEQGMMTGDILAILPPDTERVICEGYNHMDPMMAAANTPSRRKSEVIDPLMDFVFKNMGKKR